MSHIVTGPLVIVESKGQQRYLYEGAMVPDDVSPEDVKRLVDAGLISSSSDAAKPSSASSPVPPTRR